MSYCNVRLNLQKTVIQPRVINAYIFKTLFFFPCQSDSILSLRIAGVERVEVGSVLAGLEASLIQWAMEKSGGDLAKAAEMLNLSPSALQDKMSQRASSKSA